ncbi:hypothetical protein PR048_031605 [Dryococelus australis]|uniref:Uncharacterized protein n=1 Tax=Dryococelus australis TaxID=614101 RepID=A0ABQ9G5R0_9NEOP|nr:hypothetical protein PR048_031605 [Dryococelus australis]
MSPRVKVIPMSPRVKVIPMSPRVKVTLSIRNYRKVDFIQKKCIHIDHERPQDNNSTAEETMDRIPPAGLPSHRRDGTRHVRHQWAVWGTCVLMKLGRHKLYDEPGRKDGPVREDFGVFDFAPRTTRCLVFGEPILREECYWLRILARFRFCTHLRCSGPQRTSSLSTTRRCGVRGERESCSWDLHQRRMTPLYRPSCKPLRVTEASMERRRNDGAGEKREVPEKTRRPVASSEFGRLLTWTSSEPSRVIEARMEQHWNEGAGENGDPRENPQTDGIVPLAPNACAVSLLASSRGEPGFNPRPSPSRIFTCGNRAERCPRLTDFLGNLPFPPALSFWRCPILSSTTLIGSQDLAVTSLPNLFTLQSRESIRAKRGEHRAAPEHNGRGNGRSPRKPADKRHRPARFPHAKIWGRSRWELNPVRLVVSVTKTYLATSCQRIPCGGYPCGGIPCGGSPTRIPLWGIFWVCEASLQLRIVVKDFPVPVHIFPARLGQVALAVASDSNRSWMGSCAIACQTAYARVYGYWVELLRLFGLLLTARSREPMMDGAAPKRKGRGNGRSPINHADQRHRPARFPLAKIKECPGRGGDQSNCPHTAAPPTSIGCWVRTTGLLSSDHVPDTCSSCRIRRICRLGKKRYLHGSKTTEICMATWDRALPGVSYGTQFHHQVHHPRSMALYDAFWMMALAFTSLNALAAIIVVAIG